MIAKNGRRFDLPSYGVPFEYWPCRETADPIKFCDCVDCTLRRIQWATKRDGAWHRRLLRFVKRYVFRIAP